MVAILGLPEELALVPEAPFSERDPWRNQKRAEFGEWVSKMEEYRLLRRRETSPEHPQHELHRRIELMKCARSVPYFVAVWCDIYEPRKRARSLGLGGSFIPFEAQVKLFDAMADCLAVEDGGPLADLAVAKSRDVGASWCMCAQALHNIIFIPETQVRLISYKKDFVDAKSTDSLFWKIDFMRANLPAWMQPRWTRQFLNLTNMDNGNAIIGEATTQRSGRGGRCTWMGFDEASFFDEFGDIWIGAAAAAESRFAFSSIYVETGPDFYKLSMSDEIPVDDRPRRVPVKWFHHPRHDDEWFENEKKRYKLKPQGFQREVLMDPFSESRVFVYPMMQHKAPDPKVVVMPSWPQFLTMDPGVKDDFFVGWGQRNPMTGEVDLLDSYSCNGKPASYVGRLLTGTLTDGERRDDADAHRLTDKFGVLFKMGATYIGDPTAWNRSIASAESVYDVLGRDFGIHVRRDYNREGKFTQRMESFFSYRSRRELVYQAIPGMRIADTPGARYWMQALRENRYRNPDDVKTMAEEQKPLHDWTSHGTSAFEFWIANLTIMLNLDDFYRGLELEKPVQPVNFRRQGGSRNVRASARQQRFS